MQPAIANTTLSENLKKLREKMGYTQDFVAKYLNVSRETISYYENGNRSVTAPHLEKLSDLFQIEPIKLKREKLDTETLRIACAFRSEGFVEEDIYVIAWFQRVVKNYLRIKKLSIK
jgi:transcriptional regulator with XRE-family HTH domain